MRLDPKYEPLSIENKSEKVRKGDPITSYLCSGGLIRGAYHNILKFNYNLYSSSLDVYQKRCVLYKLLISLRCMNESPTVAACVSTGSRGPKGAGRKETSRTK